MRYLLSTICSLALLLLCWVAQAQVLSKSGKFSIDYSNGCPPYTVNITTLNNANTYLLKYSGESVYRKDIPQTFTIEQADPEIWLIQAVNLKDANGNVIGVERDSVMLRSFQPVASNFKVYSCSSNHLAAEIQDRVYDYYEVYFGSSSTAVRADATNGYMATSQALPAGPASVRVHGRYNNSQDNCGSSTASAEVYNQLPKPVLQSLQWNTQALTVKLQYQLDPQVKYILEQLNPSSGGYETLATLNSNSTQTTITQQGLSNQYYCYRITAQDLCGNSSVSSEEVCTANWQITAPDGYNQISYQTSTSFAGTVELLRTDGTLVGTSNTASGSFRDENIVCRQEYCYKLVIRPASGTGATAESNTRCVVSQSSQVPPAVQNISSSWHNNQLVLRPDFPAFYKNLNLSLLDEGGRKLAVATADSLVYNTKPSAGCYLFTYSNGCISETAPPTKVCPLILVNNGGEVDEFLPAWNEYVGYREGVAYYELQELDAAGSVIASWNMGSSTSDGSFSTFTLADNGRRFRVAAYPTATGIAPSYSNVFTFELIMKGYFPNAFSPNGDGQNDDFRILGKFVDSYTLWIYNRWGEVLYYSEGNKESFWDGSYKGSLLPPGPYVYKAEVTTQDGKRSTLTGTVFLKR